MGPPRIEPVGLQVARTAKVLSRAFADALAEVGGSVPVWLVLVSLQSESHGMQRDLADAVGIEGPTLTHHLNRMETAGLVTRRRDPQNRRVHRVELTDGGRAEFLRLAQRVRRFDRQLRRGLGDDEVTALNDTMARLRENAAATREVDATR